MLVQHRESELKEENEDISKKLKLSVSDLSETQAMLGGHQVELRKLKVYSQSLESKHRVRRGVCLCSGVMLMDGVLPLECEREAVNSAAAVG